MRTAKQAIEKTDEKWVNALRQYLGDGTGLIPVFESEGEINAEKTMEFFMGYWGIKKKVASPPRSSPTHDASVCKGLIPQAK